jgi:hypothetical protein
VLVEFKALRQEPNSYRRLFTDEQFDLYIWYETVHAQSITGFQLVYDSGKVQKALTWRKGIGFDHMEIDEGDRGINKSPILVVDGSFEYDRIWGALKDRMVHVDNEIQNIVAEKIEDYRKSNR